MFLLYRVVVNHWIVMHCVDGPIERGMIMGVSVDAMLLLFVYLERTGFISCASTGVSESRQDP